MRVMPLTIAASVVLLAGAAVAALHTGPAGSGDLPVDITLVAQSGGLGVTGSSVSGLHLPIWMPATSVSDACQGATFTLRLSATARKASK
jgi:hypothetical protein